MILTHLRVIALYIKQVLYRIYRQSASVHSMCWLLYLPQQQLLPSISANTYYLVHVICRVDSLYIYLSRVEGIHLLNVGFLINALQHRHESVYVMSYSLSVYVNDEYKISKLILTNKTIVSGVKRKYEK